MSSTKMVEREIHIMDLQQWTCSSYKSSSEGKGGPTGTSSVW